MATALSVVPDAAFAAFGSAATYTPPGGDAVAVTVILRGGSEDAQVLRGRRARAWLADLRSSEVAQPQKAAALAVAACEVLPAGGNFVVADFSVDRPGLVWRLDLEKQA
ncbi:MAG: hypothetical protein AB7R90_19450 [Reyranellaceae bacterium]